MYNIKTLYKIKYIVKHEKLVQFCMRSKHKQFFIRHKLPSRTFISPQISGLSPIYFSSFNNFPNWVLLRFYRSSVLFFILLVSCIVVVCLLLFVPRWYPHKHICLCSVKFNTHWNPKSFLIRSFRSLTFVFTTLTCLKYCILKPES